MNANPALTASPPRRAFSRRVKQFLLIGMAVSAVVLLITSTLPRVEAWAYVAELKTPSERIELSRWSDEASAHFVGERIPEINLSDGRAILASYVGDENLRLMFERNEARPLALASADFDEDGVPDLVGGYDVGGGGAIALYRGNVDAIYPHSPEAQKRKAENAFTDTPFLSPSRLSAVVSKPDFIGTGDFDADGHWDIVTATRGANVLRWVAGDGRGNFGQSKEVSLPGGVTAMVTGETNRADGLTDVVVGVGGAQGARLLIFESPEGALRAQPEITVLPGVATSLALGQLDDGYEMDLVVAAGRDLMLVHGRDRKLSQEATLQTKILPPKMDRRTFDMAIVSAVITNFTGSQQPGIALLFENGDIQALSTGDEGKQPGKTRRIAAWQSKTIISNRLAGATQLARVKVSSSPGDDLLVLDASGQLLILHDNQEQENLQTTRELVKAVTDGGEMAAVLPMRLDVDALSDLVLLTRNNSSPAIMLSAQSENAVGDEISFQPAKLDTPVNPTGDCPASPITVGETITGVLSDTDCTITTSGSYFDAYSFRGSVNQTVTITMSSSSFDTFLYLRSPNGTLLTQDDNGGAGTNSIIRQRRLTVDGTYTIQASSKSRGQVGIYELTLNTIKFCRSKLRSIKRGRVAQFPRRPALECIWQASARCHVVQRC